MPDMNPADFIPMFRAEAMDRLRRTSDHVLALERDPAAKGLWDECRREIHTVKGAAGMVGLTAIAQQAHALEDLLMDVGSGKQPLTPALIGRILTEVDQLRAAVDAAGQPSVPAPSAAADGAGTDDLWRIPRARIEQLLTLAMELESSQARVREWTADLEASVRRVREFRRGLAEVLSELQLQARMVQGLEPLLARVADYDRVAERLRGQLHVLSETFQGTQASHEAIVESLGQEARALRLIPCATIFDGLPRLGRDLAVSCGKQVAMVVQGVDVGVDRRLVEELKSCVLHLVRNSIDHGLELPAQRLRAGKPAEGTIRLSARHRGQLLFIEVADDGRGVQPDRVARTAIARGLLTEAQARELSDADLLQLIFTPGFSTAERVTEISGRGVGMDAVKRMVEHLQGNLALESCADVGTTVTLSLPLTVGIIPVLVLESQKRILTVPFGSVQGSTALNAQSLEDHGGALRLRWQGQHLPVVDVRLLTASLPSGPPLAEGTAVVVRSQGQIFALLTDRVVGERELCLQPWSPYIGAVPYISGAGLLDQGDVALMLDITQCVPVHAEDKGDLPHG